MPSRRQSKSDASAVAGPPPPRSFSASTHITTSFKSNAGVTPPNTTIARVAVAVARAFTLSAACANLASGGFPGPRPPPRPRPLAPAPAAAPTTTLCNVHDVTARNSTPRRASPVNPPNTNPAGSSPKDHGTIACAQTAQGARPTQVDGKDDVVRSPPPPAPIACSEFAALENLREHNDWCDFYNGNPDGCLNSYVRRDRDLGVADGEDGGLVRCMYDARRHQCKQPPEHGGETWCSREIMAVLEKELQVEAAEKELRREARVLAPSKTRSRQRSTVLCGTCTSTRRPMARGSYAKSERQHLDWR